MTSLWVTEVAETIRFTDDILNAAKTKAQQIIAEAEGQRRTLLEEAKTSISREAAEIVRNAQANAQGIRLRYVSEVRHRVKLKEQQEKDNIISSVLNEARNKVIEMSRNQAKYIPYLRGLVADAVRQLDLETVTIHLNAEDLRNMDRKKFLDEVNQTSKTPHKIVFGNEPITASGGVVVSSPDGKIRIVNTFEQRSEALEHKLLVEAGKLLFSSKN